MEKRTLALQGFSKITEGKEGKGSCLHYDGCDEKREIESIVVVVYFRCSSTEPG